MRARIYEVPTGCDERIDGAHDGGMKLVGQRLAKPPKPPARTADIRGARDMNLGPETGWQMRPRMSTSVLSCSVTWTLDP